MVPSIVVKEPFLPVQNHLGEGEWSFSSLVTLDSLHHMLELTACHGPQFTGCVWDRSTNLLHWVDIFRAQVYTYV